MDIKPFGAFLPAKHIAQQVVSKPFDFYTHEQLDEILLHNQQSFLNIVKPDYRNADKAEVNSEELFARSRGRFLQFVNDGIYSQLNSEAYFIYRQTANGQSATGLIVGASVNDYKRGLIKIHEQTIERKEVVLKNYLRSVKINAEPVLLTYPSKEELSARITTVTDSQPAYCEVAVDGVHHQLWLVDGDEDKRFFTEQFAGFTEVFVADGHHRLASSALLYDEFATNNPNSDKLPNYTRFMAALYADDQLGLFEFNRLVKDLNGFTEREFIAELEKYFDVRKVGAEPVKPANPHEFTVYLHNTWFYLTMHEHYKGQHLQNNPLDAELLTELILKPILNISDLRADKRVAFTSGVQGLEAVARRVDSGRYVAAFVLHPVHIDQFYDISRSGKTMPPKSTWFEPKLLNGLVVYSYE
ncbi:MAG: DUF1015 family protein [Sphingobacteriales bacterium JAD_PAG50586_3]|nr:MAG: DUF1015 family protein [Sphingobacteriales bacterium JAD_PAG50586_3]